MARTNTYTCATCGTTYEFCLKCEVSKPDYDAEKFHSRKCAEIYGILSKHGCNLISSEEAFLELSEYKIDEITLVEDVLAHVDKIKSDIGIVVDKTPVVEESAIVEEVAPVEATSIFKTNKKNKKKW